MQAPKARIAKKTKHRQVGIESENQFVHIKSGYNINKTDVKNIWKALVKTGRWEPTIDPYTKALIGVTQDRKEGAVVLNTDRGVCNIEIAMPPEEDLTKAYRKWKVVFTEILSISKPLGFSALGIGTLPRAIREKDTYSLVTEKCVYKFTDYLFKRQNLMLPISAGQINIDVAIKDLADTMNCLTQIGGFLIAVTANSPIEDDAIQKWKEIRMLHYKFAFTNPVTHAFENIVAVTPPKPHKDLASYLRYNWSAFPLITIKDGKWARIKDLNVSGWQYLTSGKTYKGIDANDKPISLKADQYDLDLMVALGWPDVKPHLIFNHDRINLKDFTTSIRTNSLEEYLKDKIVASYIEVRTCATAPIGEEMALPSLVLGLVNNLSDLKKFCKKFSWKEGDTLRDQLAIHAMDYSFKGKPVSEYISELIRIAGIGLKKRGLNEEKYLAILKKRVKNKMSPADNLIKIFKQKGIRGVVEKVIY